MNLYKTIEIGKNINTSAAHIYNVLCHRENQVINSNQLAEELGMSPRSFFRSTKALRENNYITIETVRHDVEGYNIGCIYKIIEG